ncbi:MAG: ribonucleotide-diphosphate reductase subunit beta [Pseudomonadota bacterium]
MQVESMQNHESHNHELNRSNPAYPPCGWDNGRFTIQNWLEQTPWRHLNNTEYGLKKTVAKPIDGLWEDPLLGQIHKIDIAMFLTAERLSYHNIAALIGAAPDEQSQMFLATQTLDEARHYEVFCRHLADFGVTPEQREAMMERVTTPAMRKFYDLICEQVDKRNFITAMLSHNIILEGMAYPLYRYQRKYWSRFDPGLSQIIEGAFADEVHHVTFGEAIMRHHARGGEQQRNELRRLTADFHRLMTEVFEGVINHYVGLYQEAANNHMHLMGDIEIFPGHTMASLSEEDQVRLLLKEVQNEHSARLARIGLSA